MDILLALISGGAIGAVLGVVGAGGAMLSVPILLYVFGFTAIPATTGALAIVLAAAVAGSIPKIRATWVSYQPRGLDLGSQVKRSSNHNWI